MKLSIAALNVVALNCIYATVFGMLVELVVNPGDNVTLHCDCEAIIGQDIQWVKICSLNIQRPLIISAYNNLIEPIPRFSLSWNIHLKSYDLIIENITESDLGLYYCSRVESKRIQQNGIIMEKDVRHTGETLTKLTYGSPESRPEPVCDCRQCWIILQTVCPVLLLLFVILAFVCGYRCCCKTVESEDHQSSYVMQRDLNQEQHRDAKEVCYASLNIPRQGGKRKKSKRLPNSHFSVYNSIKTHS